MNCNQKMVYRFLIENNAQKALDHLLEAQAFSAQIKGHADGLWLEELAETLDDIRELAGVIEANLPYEAES